MEVRCCGGIIILGGCFSSAGPGALVKLDGKMNNSKCQDILLQNLLFFVKKLKMIKNLTLHHDNDQKQTSKPTKTWLRKRKIKVLEWPSQSPLQSPTKTMNDLKRSVHERATRSLKELELFLQRRVGINCNKVKRWFCKVLVGRGVQIYAESCNLRCLSLFFENYHN